MWLMFFTAKKGAPANSECSAKYANVSSGEAGILSLIGCHYKYYDYLPVAPFIVGVLLIYYFLIYCIELASRMLKLLILEMISPIPIIMSIDPNQKNKLSNFIKTYIPIYLQIFLRVLTFYGAFAVGSLVIGSAETIAKGSTNVDWFLKVLIVIGVFQGMKELPKLIEDALGFKISGGNSEKTFGGYVRGIMGGTTGLALGGIAGGVTGGVGGAVVGAISGGVSSLAGAAGAKNSGEAISRTIANIGKSGRVGGLVRDVGGLFPYTGALIGNATGGQKKDANKLKGYESSIEKENTAINNITKAAELRSRLNSTMTSEYERINGSLSDRLANDDRLNELRLSMNDSSVPQTAQVKFDNQKLLEEAEQAVRNEYNEDKSRWMSNQLELASNTSDISTLAPETQAIKRDLENVNTFANDVGLSSKIVTATTNFESLSQQDVVDIYKHEQQRRNIEEERKEFKESEGFKNREQLQKFNSEQKKRHGGR